MTLFDFAKKNILRDKNKYIYYFVNCTFSVFIFFLFSVLSFHPAMKVIDKESTMGLILIFGESISVLFALSFISYSVSCFLKGRSKQFGIITILGASKKQLNRLIFFENMIVGFASIVCGIIVGMVFSKLFLAVANKVIGVDDFIFYFPFKALILTIVVLGFVFFLIAYFTPKLIRKEKIIKLIKKEVQGEKKEKLNFVIIMVLFLVPFEIWLFLIKSDLAKSMLDNPLFLIVFFLAIVSITYLIFALYMRAKMVIFKRSFKYYRNTNMIALSNMKSTIRSNAQSMTLTSLLYAISFFSMIIMFSMSNNVLQETEKITPYAVTYTTFKKNVPVEKHLSIIEEELKALRGYKKLRFQLYFIDDEFSRTTIMPVSQYNTIMRFLNRDVIDVKKNEIYLVSGHASEWVKNIPREVQKLLQNEGLILNIVGKSDSPIVLTGFTNSVSVINDKIFGMLSEQLIGRDIYAFHFDHWQENAQVSEKLKGFFEEALSNREISFISAYSYFSTSQLQNNLTLYIGAMLCFAFLLAVASLIYSRLYSNIEREAQKYKGMVKIGLSKKELSNIITHSMKLLVITPFNLAIIYLWLGVLFVERYVMISNIITAFYCTVVLILLQLIFYLFIKKAYRNAVFERVFTYE